MSYAAAIRTRGLSKDYGEGHGLFDLDLEVERGEIFGFLGPNGAGKSTTMRLLLDLIAPTAGSATLMDLDSRADSLEIRRRVGYLPGDFALYPKLSGAAMLDYLAELRGGVDSRVRDALAERFDAELDRPRRELSTGNRQKLGLIQAFMHEPELLILDEPIAGLDPLVQQSFHGCSERWSRRAGRCSCPRTRCPRSSAWPTASRSCDGAGWSWSTRSRTCARSPCASSRSSSGDGAAGRRAPSAPRRPRRHAQGSHVVVAFEGSADPLVKAIARYEVRSIRSRDDDLEEIFLRYYRGPEDE